MVEDRERAVSSAERNSCQPNKFIASKTNIQTHSQLNKEWNSVTVPSWSPLRKMLKEAFRCHSQLAVTVTEHWRWPAYKEIRCNDVAVSSRPAMTIGHHWSTGCCGNLWSYSYGNKTCIAMQIARSVLLVMGYYHSPLEGGDYQTLSWESSHTPLPVLTQLHRISECSGVVGRRKVNWRRVQLMQDKVGKVLAMRAWGPELWTPVST